MAYTPAATATPPVTARKNPPSGSSGERQPGQRQQPGHGRSANDWPRPPRSPRPGLRRPPAPCRPLAAAGRNRSGSDCRGQRGQQRDGRRRRRGRTRPGSPAGQLPQRGDNRLRPRRAPGDLQIDRQDVPHRPGHAVGAGEHSAVTRAVTDRDDQLAGRGPRRRVRRSGSVMFRVTTPVTSSASACRGEATSRAPYRSASYTGPNAAPISTSHPLHDPASTCRIWTEPRSPAPSGAAAPRRRRRGLRDSPVRADLAQQTQHRGNSSNSRQQQTQSERQADSGTRLHAQALQQFRLPGQHAGEDLPGHPQQFRHLRAGQRVETDEPSFLVATRPARRSTARCWDRFAASMPTSGSISPTARSAPTAAPAPGSAPGAPAS